MLIVQNDLVNNMDKDMVKALAMATSAGLTLLFCIGGFIWIGYKLDTWMDTMPLCMVILGLIGALTGFICYINRLNSEVFMNQYIKFIRHVLWACFFVTF